MALMPKTSSRQSPKMDSASAISPSLTVRGGRNLTDSRAPAHAAELERPTTAFFHHPFGVAAFVFKPIVC